MSRTPDVSMRGRRAGLTLVEVLISTVITTLVAAGTLMAFITSARGIRTIDQPSSAEASVYAQQTVERFRNYIACDSPWFNQATCTVQPGNLGTWQADPFQTGGGSESIRQLTADRRYCLTSVDSDGVAGLSAGDPLSVNVRVCWDQVACPAVGSPCP